jgi:hypothetical protein
MSVIRAHDGHNSVHGVPSWNLLNGAQREHGEVAAAIDPVPLRDRGDVVRFYRDGSPAVQLRSFDTGAPINIARRLIEPFDDGTKNLTLSIGRVLRLGDDVVGTLSTRGTLIDWIGDIDPEGETSRSSLRV